MGRDRSEIRGFTGAAMQTTAAGDYMVTDDFNLTTETYCIIDNNGIRTIDLLSQIIIEFRHSPAGELLEDSSLARL